MADSTPIAVGEPAPDFALESDVGGTVRLSTLRGQPVVLFFYPKDNTPGCTTEACDFRDRMERVDAAGGHLFGISRDSKKRHDNFRTKHGLNFPLLIDPDAEVHAAYGAWGEKVMYGRKLDGVIRTTVLIDADGIVRQLWSKVRVKGHADKVVAALESLT